MQIEHPQAMKMRKQITKFLCVALQFLLAGAIIGLPTSNNLQSSIASAASPDKYRTAFEIYTAQPDDAATNLLATSFRFPINGDWQVASDFGDTTDSGIHLGEDASMPEGTGVYASAEGIVKFAGQASGYGQAVIIEHDTGNEQVCTVYGHLNLKLGLQVSPRQEVSKGQIIGYVASNDENEDVKTWSPHIHFGIRKGAYQTNWGYDGYDPPGNIEEWYDPTDFINRHQEPQDKSLVSPSNGPYQDRIFWLQNNKLYWITESINNDSNLEATIDGMASLPGWDWDQIVNSSSALLESYSGWPDGIARFITTGSESNGLLIRNDGNEAAYLLRDGTKLLLPDQTAIEYAGYDIKDVIHVTETIYYLFSEVIDNAQEIDKPDEVIVGPGKSFTIWLEIKNTGTAPWSEKLQYYLGWQSGLEPFPDSESFQKIALAASDNITPGMTKRWSIEEVTAPIDPGTYTIVWQMMRDKIHWFGDVIPMQITVGQPNFPPNIPSTPSGPGSGEINIPYTYSTSATDPDNEKVKYIFDWGDGTTLETDYISSSTSISKSYSWQNPGIYNVRVAAIDTHSSTSDWSSPTTVTISKPSNHPPYTPSIPAGPGLGYIGIPATYTTSALDMDGDQIKYTFYWADGNTSETSYANPGTIAKESHIWDNPGTYHIRVMATDSRSAISNWSNDKIVTIVSPPSVPSTPSGPNSGFTDTSYTYSTLASAINPDGNQVKYIFDWGDGTTSETKFLDSGIFASESHGWSKPGNYTVKTKAIDRSNAASEWSDGLDVTIFSQPTSSPSTPTLSSPEDEAIVFGTPIISTLSDTYSIDFTWEASDNATKYFLEVNSSSSWESDNRKYYSEVRDTTQTVSDFTNNGTTYYWHVRSGNNMGWSAWSSSRSFDNAGTPSIPTLSLPTNNDIVSDTSVTFEWSTANGADRYWLEVNTDPTWNEKTCKFLDIVGNVTEYEDMGYKNDNTTYYWRVRAGNNAEWGAWSSGRCFVNSAPLLSSPEENENVPGNTITFNWTALSGATKYLLEVNEDPDFDPEKRKFFDNVGNTTEYDDTGYPNDGTKYYWRMRAGNESGWISRSESRSFTNTQLEKPAAPTLTSPTDGITVSGSTLTFKWSAETRATYYLLEVNKDLNWAKATRKFFGNVGDVTQYEDTNYPNDGTTYYWRVRAGNESGLSAPSESQSFVNFSNKSPTLSSPSDEDVVSGTSIMFKWSASSGAEHYLLEINSSSSWEAKNRKFRDVVGNVLSQTVTDFPNDGTTYYWRVKAGKDAAWSAWSDTRSLVNGSVGTVTAPTLTSPADNDSVSGTSVTFKWSSQTNATQYWLEVNTDHVSWGRKTRKFFGNVGNNTSYNDKGYPNDGTVYYWRARAGNDGGWSPFSSSQSFTNW